MAAFAGPGFLVAVGYMDPGNWATDLAGGAKFGYALLCGRHDLEPDGHPAAALVHQARRRHRTRSGAGVPRPLLQADVWLLWILCEMAIAACDLAEVIGSAIGLQLLFGIPLVWGCLITCADVLLVLFLQNKGFRLVEALVVALIAHHRRVFCVRAIFPAAESRRSDCWDSFRGRVSCKDPECST